MLNAIIFSKNRACQLHLLLESIKQHGSHLFPCVNINVIYTYTSNSFKDGYNKLILHPISSNINFILQTNFQENTLELLNNINRQPNSYICFFVDDNIIFRNIPLQYNHICDVFAYEQIGTISLRLGDNVQFDDIYNNKLSQKPSQVCIIEYGDGTKLVAWDWDKMYTHCNYGYPFSVDGNIYRTKDVVKSVDYEFDNPNGFEGRFDRNKLQKAMCSLENSVLVNTPFNLVGSSNNNAGRFFEHTLEELNNKYLDGYKIKLQSIIKHDVVACHQEMEIEFEKV